ncbi:MAG: adenylate/guanylate cyclase domain-containing protein [Spirochaetota bacterium]|nr:adenylate/guanylate cyclase domain-containing protein [Spirochaetota bacterium]
MNQRRLLEDEKYRKASTLTRILSGPAEFYLDKNIMTTKEELRIKYETIVRESSNFKTYNDDIVSIILTDERGIIQFSTQKSMRKQKSTQSYIKRCLKQKEEKLYFYDYTEKKKNKKTKEVINKRYRAITYPIFLHRGNVVNLLKDFKKYYNKYHNSDKKARNQIYRSLWRKYRKTLGDEFNNQKLKKQDGFPSIIVKASDIDFLFLKLFSNIMTYRDKRIKKGEKWLWRDKWLFLQKKKKIDAYLNDMPARAKEINDLIIKRLNYLSSQVENVRRLGALAIIFNVDMIKKELGQNISQVMNIALVMIILCGIAFLIVLNYMIQNLKKLEKWALIVSAGNLGTKIEIDSNDEIGRLGDIFNNMLDELKMKYHLEKFVSRSTRSMIGRKKGDVAIGTTKRMNLAFIFSDVRGFTSFSEKNDPETVIEVLNFYLELQAKIITSKKGDIDDYTGDEVMAHFGGEKRADTAIETAIEIMRSIKRANMERTKKNLPIFEVGIGVHGGDVVVGNIGSSFRMDYACVGDAVNLSARLCSLAKPSEILVSKELFLHAKKKYRFQEIPPIYVKGKGKKIPIVRIII